MAEEQDFSGCQVDWTWLQGQQIVETTSDLEKIVFRFASGLTLSVTAAVWKGRAFLAFDPYKAPESDPTPAPPARGEGG